MKKILVALLFFALNAKAQDFLTKISNTAAVVIKYSGNNFSQNLPLTKLDGYSFIKTDFFKMLGIDTLTSLQNIGIDLEQDAYQYVSLDDSALSFISLMHIKNEPQFLQLVKANFNKGTISKMVVKNGFNFLPTSDNTYLGWNGSTAMIVNTSSQNKKSYYQYYYTNDSVKTAIDSLTDLEVARIIKAKEAAENKAATVKPKTPQHPGKGQPAPKKPAAKKPIINENYETQIRDSLVELRKDLWEQQQDMIARKKQQAVAEKIMEKVVNGSVISIEKDPSYKKVIDANAHMSIWVNAENLSNQYWNYFSKTSFSVLQQKGEYFKDTLDGFKTGVNVFFEKDKIRMNQRAYAADSKIAKLGMDVMNSKQNPAIGGYVNPGNLGYFSMSVNTEAMEYYYYSMLRKYLSRTPYMSEYSDVIDAYIDLLEIVVDEKGVADLFPGNYLFVLHDMKTQNVTYTDYEYDKDFNGKEVKKTKKELSPDFSFIMETRKEGFLEKIARLPLKYAEKYKLNYKDKGGYYQLVFDSGAYPISSLYFVVKDGKAIVTTSKEVIDLTLAGKGFATTESEKNAILNNNYSFKLSSKKLLEIMENQVSTDANKKQVKYLAQNFGDITMESSVKEGMIQGETTVNITGNHTNSFEFLFNIMDEMQKISRSETVKKIN